MEIMVTELVRACVFCLLCATHAHCSSHHNTNNTHLGGGLKASYENGRESSLQTSLDSNTQFLERSKRSFSEDEYIKQAFIMFGDGEKLNQTGFRNLLAAVGIKLIRNGKSSALRIITEENNSTNEKEPKMKCVSLENILVDPINMTQSKYKEICPWIISEIIHANSPGNDCMNNGEHLDDLEKEASSILVVWVYASISVILISLCGLLAVAVIPLMQMTVYQGLLQFLVALAVGTLCGDALLHLLPHAMLISHGAHDHEGWNGDAKGHEEQHDLNLWRGLVAVLAVIFFYFTEKMFSVLTEWHKKRQRKNKKTAPRVHVMREETHSNEENRVGEKLCKHKYSSYPYCYGEITNSATENLPQNGPSCGDTEINNIRLMRDENGLMKLEENELPKEDVPCSEKQLLETSADNVPEYTVILREHETRHHGHAHTHGHVHSAPSSLSSVAWMVVMGDGLHNLADGLAIGTAFGANVGGGFSTAVAVFCHELPHEIGDFAVLLKAGMSAKQAVFYNLLSSILCFFGMALGIALGHNDTMKPWVFSFAAGMFLYIALVDMVPELSSSHSKEGGSLCQCFLQFCGLISGVGIMLVIALYEHALMESFQHSF